MPKEIVRPQTVKQPRKMEIKTLVPWMIILIIVSLATGLITGWTLRTEQTNEVKSEVARQLEVSGSIPTIKK